jgi:hypothetical protein
METQDNRSSRRPLGLGWWNVHDRGTGLPSDRDLKSMGPRTQCLGKE